MPMLDDIAPEFRRAFIAQYLNPIVGLVIGLIFTPIIIIPRHSTIDPVAFLMHDAFSPAYILHTVGALFVVWALILFGIFKTITQGKDVRERLRQASMMLQQAVPRDVQARCWQQAVGRSVCWRVTIFDNAAPSDSTEEIGNPLAVHGKLHELDDPRPAQLYRLENIPYLQVVRFADGTMVALTPLHFQAATAAVVAPVQPAVSSGTRQQVTMSVTIPTANPPMASSITSGNIAPEFSAALTLGYRMLAVFFGVPLVAYLVFRIVNPADSGTIVLVYLIGGLFGLMGLCTAIVQVILWRQLRQATTLLRQAAPRDVRTRCWMTQPSAGGNVGTSMSYRFFSFTDDTLPTTLTEWVFRPIAANGQLPDDSESLHATVFASDMSSRVVVLRFDNGTLSALAAIHERRR